MPGQAPVDVLGGLAVRVRVVPQGRGRLVDPSSSATRSRPARSAGAGRRPSWPAGACRASAPWSPRPGRCATLTSTCSPRAARSVGPEVVAVEAPGRGRAVPRRSRAAPSCAVRSNTRRPRSSTCDWASGGIASGRSKSTSPTVSTFAVTYDQARKAPNPTTTTTTRLVTTRKTLSRRRISGLAMLVEGHGDVSDAARGGRRFHGRSPFSPACPSHRILGLRRLDTPRLGTLSAHVVRRKATLVALLAYALSPFRNPLVEYEGREGTMGRQPIGCESQCAVLLWLALVRRPGRP